MLGLALWCLFLFALGLAVPTAIRHPGGPHVAVARATSLRPQVPLATGAMGLFGATPAQLLTGPAAYSVTPIAGDTLPVPLDSDLVLVCDHLANVVLGVPLEHGRVHGQRVPILTTTAQLELPADPSVQGAPVTATPSAGVVLVWTGATWILAGSAGGNIAAGSVRGKRVVVVEDGPTLTHGGMKYGAGILAAAQLGAHVVHPRPPPGRQHRRHFPTLPRHRSADPGMGYGAAQIRDLEATINRVDCDAVILATPIDLRRILHLDKPSVRVTYELDDSGSQPTLAEVLRRALNA